MDAKCAVTRQGRKEGVQQRPRRKHPLLTVFQEGYELRVWNALLVTRPVQALLPISPCPVPLSPKGFAGLPAVLPPAISCLRFLTHCFCWLHRYTGYTLSRLHIYQWLAVDPGAYQPLGTTGYTGYS